MGAQNLPTALIYSPFATQAEDGGFPPSEYTRTTFGRLSIVPDSPAKPVFPSDILNSSREEVRPPRVPVLQRGPMELRRPYLYDWLDPFSIEPAQSRYAVGSGTHAEPGGFSGAASSQQKMCVVCRANARSSVDDTCAPFPCPAAGQAVSCVASGGIGPLAGTNPTTHIPECGKPDWIGEGRGEVAISTGDRNRME